MVTLPDYTRSLKAVLDTLRRSPAYGVAEWLGRVRLMELGIGLARCGLSIKSNRAELRWDDPDLDRIYDAPESRAFTVYRDGELFGALALLQVDPADELQLARLRLHHPVWLTEGSACLVLAWPPALGNDGRPIPQLELSEGASEVERELAAGFLGMPVYECQAQPTGGR